MATEKEVYMNRIAYPDRLGDKVFIGYPSLSRHDDLYINGWKVELPDEYFEDGREIPMKPEDVYPN